ncbi:hypothetical protein DPMN_173193 [Dreissena polymorpha]|uniref:Uncharacterized protein n=1 Tax=Dreissena polymorpha TaxID=45954 RepID=A0A9D4E149_DREPO|nr:hypothetical protein DPMN_173193 [Dreissena polymorpha]
MNKKKLNATISGADDYGAVHKGCHAPESVTDICDIVVVIVLETSNFNVQLEYQTQCGCTQTHILQLAVIGARGAVPAVAYDTIESETVDLHIWLIRRKKYVTIHGRLHQAWEEEKLTTTELLRIISHINALGPSTAVHHMLDDDES